MKEGEAVQESIWEALKIIQHFVKSVTGEAPTQAEIARALRRYFVLNEIKDHIMLEREGRDICWPS